MEGGVKHKLVTLVPEGLAKPGSRFLLAGTSDECTSCRLRRVCVDNVEEGRVYEVLSTRQGRFSCPLGGELIPCDVELAKLEVAMPAEDSIEGVIVEYSPIECDKITCPNYLNCSPNGLHAGDRVRILEVLRGLRCEAGRSLSLCRVELTL